MVVDELSDVETDRIFHALADGTRRDIVRRVMVREQSVSALAGDYAMSFAAVQKHVAVLERAALVVKRKHGREQLVSGNADRLQQTARLLDEYADLWAHRADQIAGILAETGRNTPP